MDKQAPTKTRSLLRGRRILGNNRGVALLVALFAMVFMIFIATQVSYETQVEYLVASQGVNRLKAYYAAKSGVELSLFRILLYKKALASFSQQIKDNPAMGNLLNQIWQFPFSWPPVLPNEASSIDKDDIQAAVKESFMDAQYLTTIQGEGGKIDVNALGSRVQPLADVTQTQILRIFQVELQNNEAFKEKYQNEDFNALVNNIRDWVDEDTNGRNRGDESGLYEQPRDEKVTLPPNRSFRTLEELHMVAGMTDEFYNLLAPRLTVFGTRGINPNTAPEEVLKSLDPQITSDNVGKIIERRSNPEKGGPFRNDDDFYGFLDTLPMNTDDLERLKIPFYYDAEYNFRIISTGKYANVHREITVITYDLENLSQRYAQILKEDAAQKSGNQQQEEQQEQPQGQGQGENGQQQDQGIKFKAPKGRPNVVYWGES